MKAVRLGAFGGLRSEAFEVHDISGTVGWADKRIGGLDYHRAFLVPKDVFTLSPGHELPGFAGQVPDGTWVSEAWGLNGCQQIVGRATTPTTGWSAFLYQPGAANLTDLTSLAPPGAGWVLTSAIGISDAGHIVGSGTKNGASRQWTMYPQPQE